MSLLNSTHKELIEAVENDSLVIFAGAGISKRAGLPLWNELILKIIENIKNNNPDTAHILSQHWERPLGKNKIFEILDLIKKYDLTSFAERTLNDEIFKKGLIVISSNMSLSGHSKLWQLSQNIITPNYDLLFESCSEFKTLNQQPITNTSLPFLSTISIKEGFLLKLHGSIDHPKEIILFESDYKAQYEKDSAAKRTLQQLINNQTILFLGTSMSDPYINELIRRTNEIFNNSSAKNFILTTEVVPTADIIKITGDPISDMDSLVEELIGFKKLSKINFINKKGQIISNPETNHNKNKLNLFPKPKQYFTGRDKEIEDFKNAITTGNTFITIDGAGGIGKTQFVSKCIEKFISTDKVMWYDCKPESHFDTLITFAGYPELLEGTSKTDKDKFSAFKDKLQDNEFYLFLDNFQETNSKPIFKEFLHFIQDYLKKGCVIVIDRDDITTINLTPKRIHIAELKENKLEYAKALIAHSYDGLITINDIDLIKLCDELQGYPLAIDFAVLLLSEGEKHSDIISKIVQAEGGEEISERLLNAIFSRPDATQEERDFMMQFSVFTGSVPEHVVREIIGSDIMKIAPKKLKKKNLITIINNYYETHSLVRAFCYKKLHDKDELHKKVANYYLHQRNQELSPSIEERIFYHLVQSKQWNQIEIEIENNGRKYILLGQLGLVKELIEILIKLKIDNPILNILYGDIAEIQGNWDVAKNYYEHAKEQSENDFIKAEGMVKYAEMLHRKGNVKAALPLYEEAYAFTKNIGSLKKIEARAINDVGLVSDFLGKTNEALEYYLMSLQIREEIDSKEDVATSMNNIGALYFNQGDLSKALEFHEKVLRLGEEIGDKESIARALRNIGNIFSTQGELEKAFEYQKKSLNIVEEIGNKQGISSSLIKIGEIYHHRGELQKALEYYEECLRLDEEIGDRTGIAATFSYLGGIYDSQGELARALEFHEKCLKIYEEIGNKEGISHGLGNIGSIYFDQGMLKEALELQEQSLKIKEEIGDKLGISNSYAQIGRIYLAKGKLIKALKYLEECLKIREEIGDKKGIASTLGNIGNVHFAKGEFVKALDYYERDLKISETIGNKQGIAASLGNIGSIYSKKGELSKSLEYHERSLKIKELIGDKLGISVSLSNIGSIYTDNKINKYDVAMHYYLTSLAISNSIGVKPRSNSTLKWIDKLRENLRLDQFKILAQNAYDTIDPEMQKYILLQELLKEPILVDTKIGRNDLCPCGSGKKYKYCHGR